MHSIVAGGSGFIGSHLVTKLLAEGRRVTVLDNLSTGRRTNLQAVLHHPALTVIECDIVDDLPLLEPFDECYHLASPASPPGYQNLQVETLRVNSEGTRHLLEECEVAGARFLYASTSEAYGDPLEHPQNESYRGNVSTTGPRSMYDEAKRFGEAMTTAFHRTRGVDCRIVRIFNTYGPNSDPDDGRLVPNFITQALKGQPLTIYGDGAQTRSLCYVSDLVDGLVLAARAGATRGELVNLGNPEEHTILEFAARIARIAGMSPRFVFTPAAVGDDPQRRRPDISKASRLLGWTPRVALDDGLARTIDYFRTELRMGAALAAL